MIIKVGELLNSHLGTKFEKRIPIKLEEVDDFTLDKNQDIQIEIYRVPHGLAVVVPVQDIKGEAVCARTLKSFKTNFNSSQTETHFYIEEPEDSDLEEFEFIDQKNMQIDLEPCINEAILLSMPSVFYAPGTSPVERKDEALNKPFQNLKDLF